MIERIRWGRTSFYILRPQVGLATILPDESAIDRSLDFRTVRGALDFLRTLTLDAHAVNSLRRAALAGGALNLSCYQDYEIVQYVALLLVDRRLHVIERRSHWGSGGSSSSGDNSATPEPAALAARPPVRPSAPPPEPDPDTFSPDILQDQQAATLIAAARNGTPFCEQCARAARGRAA